MDQDLSKMKVSELREALKSKGLNTTGNKQDLIDRLQASSEDGAIDSKFEDELLNDDDFESEDKALLDTTTDLLKSPDSSKSNTSEILVAIPKKISLKRNVVIETPVIPQEKTEEATNKHDESSEPEKKVVKLSELSAKERMEMRAKKFGGNSSAAVLPPSKEILNARAIRFGMSSTNASNNSETSSTASSDVLKKRAERFGAISDNAKKSEYEEKLSKRKERFGAEGKVTISSSTSKEDFAEKARLRLERFKQTA